MLGSVGTCGLPQCNVGLSSICAGVLVNIVARSGGELGTVAVHGRGRFGEVGGLLLGGGFPPAAGVTGCTGVQWGAWAGG